MKRKFFKLIIFALMVALVCQPLQIVYAKDEVDIRELKEKIKKKAEVLIDNSEECLDYNACSVQYAIMDEDGFLISDSAGVYSKIENEILDSHNMYGIGSVSKMYVAAAVMQLVDKGEINLDLPLTNYLQDFKMADERYKKITPRMLLNHSSGLMGTTGRNSILLNDNDGYLHDNFLENLKCQKLKAEPGEFSVYCNDGFTLAQILVEKVSSMKFTDYIRNNFAEPLGLSTLKTPEDDFDRKLLAKTYSLNDSLLEEDPVENVMSIGAGGIYSSAEDLAVFVHSITRRDGKGILSKKSMEAMENAEYLKGVWVNDGDDNSIGYGLGFDSVNLFPFNHYGIKALCKGGDTLVYHSCVIVLPDLNITMAVNSSGASSCADESFAEAAILEVLQAEGKIADIKKDVQWTSEKSQSMPAYLKRYEGLYNMGTMMAHVKIENNGTLTLSNPDYGLALTFHYTHGDYFMMDGVPFGIRFVHEKNGNTYLEEKFYESYPELSQTAVALYAGQKVLKDSLPFEKKKIWADRGKKPFFILNEKYSSYVYSAGSCPFTNFAVDNEGYVLGSRIVSDNVADPFVQIPGGAGRDLNSYKFYHNKDGVEFADAGGSEFIGIEGLSLLDENIKEVKIGERGYTEWFSVPKYMAGKSMTVECSARASFNAYNVDGSCINNSFLSKNKSITLGAYTFIAFAGEPFEKFTVSFS